MSVADLAQSVAVVAGVVLFIWSMTRRRDKWGLNVRRTDCPQCGEPTPRVRRPKSLGQAMWGGYTCAKCGTEMDKWGRRVDG